MNYKILRVSETIREAPLVEPQAVLRPVYSDTTQFNSTQLDVELSTRSQREQLSPISSERRDPVDSVALPIVGDSSVASVRVSIATQLNCTRRRVELRRYKRTLRHLRRIVGICSLAKFFFKNCFPRKISLKWKIGC